MMLKPQNVVLLLALSLPSATESTYRSLAADLFISTSEIAGGINRLRAARLLRSDAKKPVKRAMEEFLLCGVKYAYPPNRGGQTRGLPTSYAAPPFVTPDAASQARRPLILSRMAQIAKPAV
jgi:hypothetical protein